MFTDDHDEFSDTAVPAALFCALTRSTGNPEIKIETARKAIVRDLCRVFIILGSPSMVAINNDAKK